MNKRFKITKLDAQQYPTLTLEQCKAYFATLPDFTYEDAFVSKNSEGVTMTIKGEFFMWQIQDISFPFRFFDGEIYVAVSHPMIMEKGQEIADDLQADFIEG